jgi:branched-chain amino acid transport system ATP-binding protein
LSGTAVLRMAGLRVFYGAVEALKGVSLTLDEGEIVTVLGANGAGKSTLLRTVSGLIAPREGTVRLGEEDLSGVPACQVVRRGISHAPEGRRVFATLTVEENLTMGAFARLSDRSAVEKERSRIHGLFPVLRDRRRQLAGTLSGGEQQMLAIGRALMSAPRVLLLDEPSLGLAPILVQHIFEIIREINRGGVAILLIEQNARQALALARRGYVLENGRISLEGPSAMLRDDPRVQEAYLGGSGLRKG